MIGEFLPWNPLSQQAPAAATGSAMELYADSPSIYIKLDQRMERGPAGSYLQSIEASADL